MVKSLFSTALNSNTRNESILKNISISNECSVQASSTRALSRGKYSLLLTYFLILISLFGFGHVWGQTLVPSSGSNSVTCGTNTTLTDHAGSGNYLDYANGYTVLDNSGSGVITISGTSSGESCCDYVRIYRGSGTSGTIVGTYYMNTSIPTITSNTGEALTVLFYSDGSITGAGFSITVSYSGICNALLSVPSSGSNSVTCGTNTTLTDHAGAGNYLDNANGYTVLNNSGSGVITISGTSSGESCCDYVRIFRGSGTSGTIVGTYYMNTSIPTITSNTGEALTVLFYSDGSITGAGFSISVTYSGSCCVLPCVPQGTEGTYGSGSWYASVFKSNSASQFSTYKGYVTENETFNRIHETPSGLTTNICCDLGSDLFAIRYKMTKNFTAGYYSFTIGGDDGVRLSLDGGSTWHINGWVNQGYTTYSSASSVYLSGNTNLVFEYYEDGGGSQSSFSYSCVAPSQPSVISGTTNPIVGSSQTYSVTNTTGITYNWSFPSGWNITAGQGTNSVTVTVGASNGTITCTPSTACYGNGTSRTLSTNIPNYRAQIISASFGSSNWCPGEERNVTVQIKNTGISTWNSGYATNVGVKWNTVWSDYHSRVTAGSLAAGATQTYTLPIKAMNATAGPAYSSNLTAGTYNLVFDVVNEGSCWFGNNDGSCGPGNTVYTSSAISINTVPSAVTLTNSTICSGGTISASGGSGGTIYWQGTTSNGTSTSGGSGSTSPAITTAGTYYARALASNGCWGDQGSATITVNAVPSSPNAGSDVTICAGSSTTLNGSATAPITCTGSQTSSNDTDQAIPDNNSTGISSIINVPESCQNASVISSVVLNITHPYNGDLDIYLMAPDGTQIALAEDKGGSGDNYACTFVTGGSTLPTSNVSITGNVSPQTSFSSLGSGTASGNWTLIVKDDAGSDLGTLTFWSITVPINQTQSVTYSWSNGASTQSTSVSPSSTTTYTMTATANGCSTTDEVVVTITNPTVATTLAANDFVWTGATSNDWNVPSNWLQWNGSVYNVPTGVPNASTANVILPTDNASGGVCVPNEAKIGNYSISIQNLTSESGHAFQLNHGGAVLRVFGDLTLGGTWSTPTNNSTVIFEKSGNQTIPAVTFSKLQTAGSGVKSFTTGNLTVSNVLTIGSNTTFNMTGGTFRWTKSGTGLLVNNGGTISLTGGTVDFRVNANQEIPALTYFNLTTNSLASAVDASLNTKTLIGETTVTNAVSISAASILDLGNQTLNVSRLTTAPFTVTGTFNPNSGTVNYNGAGTQAVNALTYKNLTISNSGTKTLAAGTTTVNGTLNLTGGTFAVAARTLILNGPYISGTVSNMTTTSGSDLQLNCSGTGPFTLHNSTALGNLKINSSGQVYNLNSNMTISGNLILEAGTLGLNTRSFTYSGSNISKNAGLIDATNSAGTMTFGTNAAPLTLPADLFTSNTIGNLTVNRSGGIILGSNTTVSNTLTLTDGTLTVGPNTFTMNGSTMTRTSGSIDASNLSSNLNFGNTNALTLPASSLQQNVNNLTLNGASGSLSLSQDLTILGALTIGSGKTFVAGNNTVNFTGTGNVLNVNGTFTPSASTVNFANSTGIQNIPAITYHNILSSNFGTRVLAGNVITNNDVTNSNGSLNLNDFNLTIGGNYLNSVGADGFGNFGLVPGIGSVIFNKVSGSQTLFMEAGSDFSNIQHTGAGTLHLASDLTMTGNLTNTAGTISALSADGQQSFGITIQGDWSNSAIFDPGTGYVLFEKSNGTQTVDNGTSTFYQMKQFGGASLIFSTTPEIKHDIVVNGPIAAASNFKLTGSNNQTISGSVSEIAIQDMTVNKTSGTVTLSKPVRVSGTLTMTQGDVITDATNILEIGSSESNVGSVSWNSSTGGTVRGPMKRWFGTSANSTPESGIFPIGVKTGPKSGTNRYAQVNFTQSTPGGYIIAEYKSGTPSPLPAGLPLNYSSGSYPQAIQNYEEEGYWDITPYSAAGASYAALDDKPYTLTLRMNNPSTLTTGWTPSNDGNDLFNASTIRLIRSKGSSSGTHGNWELAGTHVSATGNSATGDYYITSSNITGFSWFNGGGNNQNPLPVELVSFSGVCEEGIINLTWQTASEFNSSHFDVEKSRDGENWQVLTTLPSAGTSNELITYQSTDQNGTAGNNYFRLRQVDNDGTEKLYDPINVSCSEVTTGYFSSFPNPSGTSFQVIVNNKELVGTCIMNIVDASGKVIEQREIEMKEGINMFVVNQELTPGIYFLNISNGSKSTPVLRHAIK